jgi:hypothetical protein
MILPGILSSQITGHLSTNNFTSIATATVDSGGASTITFSSIPSTYKHLQIRGLVKQTAGSDSQNYMQFNGDTASNYSTHAAFGYGTGTGVLATASINYMSVMATTSNGTNVFCPIVMDILEYSNTNINKTIRTFSGTEQGAGGYTWLASGNWRSTSAINSITIYNNSSNNFTQYTQFALYGVK